jgi:hypothetical protein
LLVCCSFFGVQISRINVSVLIQQT